MKTTYPPSTRVWPWSYRRISKLPREVWRARGRCICRWLSFGLYGRTVVRTDSMGQRWRAFLTSDGYWCTAFDGFKWRQE